MAATSQVAVAGANVSYAAIIPLSGCKTVRIAESRGVMGFPTGDFLIKKPGLLSTAVRIQAGAQYTFTNDGEPFTSGQPIGYVAMVANGASTTFDQDEGGL